MTRREGDRLIVARERPQQCDLCGSISELRPYGPNGEAICFDCGMANRETTDAAFLRQVVGVTEVVVEPDR